jgi:transcriptional regulator with XRE-family HTH domain
MDWKHTLARLTAAGLTQTVIAERCGGVAQSTISALARGETKSPSFELGAALQKLVDELPPPESDPESTPHSESAARVPPAASESATAAHPGV